MNDARFGVSPSRAFSCAAPSDGAFHLPLSKESLTRKQIPSLSEVPFGAADNLSAQRAELANLLGRLLARWWLSDHLGAGGREARADDDATDSNVAGSRHGQKSVARTKL